MYQNVNVQTGNVEFEIEPALQEFERLAGVNPYYALVNSVAHIGSDLNLRG